MNLRLKSVDLPAASSDGKRYLISTFWPAGKDTYSLWPLEWVHELSPSYDLAEKARWEGWNFERFRQEYWKKLESPQRRPALERLHAEAAGGPVTLLYAGPAEQSPAALLKQFLEARASRFVPA